MSTSVIDADVRAGEPVGAPALVDLLLELPRAAVDFQRSLLLAPWLGAVGDGDGHPVLVLPGFLADDLSTLPLRRFVRRLGYRACAWRLGRNIGPTPDVVAGLRASIDRLADVHERNVTLIGWSLGGVMARELARAQPDRVRQVISLGSPIGMLDPEQSRASRRYERYRDLHHQQYRLGDRYRLDRRPLPVPSTAIYTRTDGIVAWRTCPQVVDDHSENIEVTGGHIGLGHHPAALLAIGDRLARSEGAWRPFRPPSSVRHWYPKPAHG
jgi:pimeloyl-ACP methyl ester carboxylesterase